MSEIRAEVMGDGWKYDPNYNRMCEFLGVDKYDRDNFDIAKKEKE